LTPRIRPAIMGWMTGDSANLQAALNFTDADLADNRVGRLSPTQSARMAKGQKTSRVSMYVMIGVVVVFLVVVGVVFLPQSFAAQPGSSSAIPPWIIVLVIAVIALIMFISFARTRRGIRNLTGAVLSVDGVANPKISTFGDANQEMMNTLYRVRVGDMNFPVPGRAQVDAFEKGKSYRAYYLKSTVPVLISAEELPD
jgi:hypothetical protein